MSYDSIEQLKNGYFVSTKYESCQCIFNPPVVIIFANFPPNRAKMSEDRWFVMMVKDVISTLSIMEMFEPEERDALVADLFSSEPVELDPIVGEPVQESESGLGRAILAGGVARGILEF